VPLPLKIAFSENPLVEPLKDRRVKPNNIELEFVAVEHPGDLFYRNLKFDEFDVWRWGFRGRSESWESVAIKNGIGRSYLYS
jgi:hypothetical protein